MVVRGVELDRSVPALLFKVGRYPLHQGSVGAVRSLGRAGVPVHAVVEDAYTPTALSRHLSRRHVWPTTGLEDPRALVEQLLGIGRRLPARAVLVPTDDEAALLAAGAQDRLAECFLLPKIDPELPAGLAGKRGLYRRCLAHGVPAPATRFPADRGQLVAFAAELGFPVVVKNLAPWDRLRAPVVPGTTLVHDRRVLLALVGEPRGVLLQAYVPREAAQDWIVHLYAAPDGRCAPVFTGLKLRSWPPHAGVTTYARALANPGLARRSARLCRALGYRGPADLDWRLDLRDGRYKLVDFNPRVGAQFRMFETARGLDVVRALHLDLTGRPIPSGGQREGRRYVAEHLDLAAFVAYRGRCGAARPPGRAPGHGGVEAAWLALDDPLPAAVTAVRALALAVRRRRH
ncbi:ATP-grasp domain-containing protein [Embleya scabrispora]|uniref:ATP-grasp domain-containing protein n=1 Tax=Embleya scabrispora TaxID=159449 RepID=A0A1T3P3T4_9ACTN|nr:ATP-grasp domain-containing protein [Embleya scabrispora]OPC83621.1 ATP-grasp domain-containing protein [Embleya scabrispora]